MVKEEKKTPLPATDRGVRTREELTQTQLEDQHFSFAGKSEIDIQAHTVRLFSESRGDFARFGFHATGFLSQRRQPRLLLRGEGSAYLSQSGAFALADGGIALVGTDASSIAPYEDAVLPHQELLLAGVPILEGLDLSGVPDGNYILAAFPLKLEGLEAAPVRAVLLEE